MFNFFRKLLTQRNRQKPDTARIVTIPIDRFVVPFQLGGLARTIACWSDLLGFGKHLSKLGWSLASPEADDLVQRLERFATNARQWETSCSPLAR